MKSYWAYMLRCADDSYYIGVTSKIEQRIAQHELGTFVTCYTYKRRPVTLVYCAEFSTPEEAIFVEKRLKGWRRAKKDALTRNDWNAICALARSYAGDHPSTGSG